MQQSNSLPGPKFRRGAQNFVEETVRPSNPQRTISPRFKKLGNTKGSVGLRRSRIAKEV